MADIEPFEELKSIITSDVSNLEKSKSFGRLIYKIRSFPRKLECFESMVGNLDESEENYYSIVKKTFLSIDFLPFWWEPIYTGQIFYRSRVLDGPNIYNHIRQMKYPPIEFSSNYGRANIPYQSLFYCAEKRETAHREVAINYFDPNSPQETLEIVTGIWEFGQEIEVVYLTTSNKDEWKTDLEKAIGKNFSNKLNQIEDIDIRKGYEGIINFVADKFAKKSALESGLYEITSAYSNLAFFGIFDFKGLMYPSVADSMNIDERGVNLVLTPEVIETQKIKPIQFEKTKVQLITNNAKELIEVKELESQPAKEVKTNGEIVW